MKYLKILLIIFVIVNSGIGQDSISEYGLCTTFAAGKKATVDGSVMNGHTCDGNCDFALKVIPRRSHEMGDNVIIDYEGAKGGEFEHKYYGETDIPQVPETFKYFMVETPIGNEYQVFFGENTCYTKPELSNLGPGVAMLDFTQVAALGLQRGKTAKEAILAAGALIEKYGLQGIDGWGESFLVSDQNEAWCFEIVGESTIWVAQRIPDDHVCPHANRMRIGVVDVKDKKNFLMSPNLIQNAIDKGFYDPAEDGPFNFADVYSGDTHSSNKMREWRMFSLLCPSQNWEIEQEFPFSIKPEKEISVEWWINNIWRDHLEDTIYDQSKRVVSGPFHAPESFRIDGVKNERTISRSYTSYSWVSQSRSKLPNEIGGLFWFGLGCPRSTCYVPFYTGINHTPESWQKSDFTSFDLDSPWWYFESIDLISLLKYNDIHKDIREVFGALEVEQFRNQLDFEKVAIDLFKSDPIGAKEFLTSYSNSRAVLAEKNAKDLFYDLIVKYSNLYSKKTEVSEEWLELLKTNPLIIEQ